MYDPVNVAQLRAALETLPGDNVVFMGVEEELSSYPVLQVTKGEDGELVLVGNPRHTPDHHRVPLPPAMTAAEVLAIVQLAPEEAPVVLRGSYDGDDWPLQDVILSEEIFAGRGLGGEEYLASGVELRGGSAYAD